MSATETSDAEKRIDELCVFISQHLPQRALDIHATQDEALTALVQCAAVLASQINRPKLCELLSEIALKYRQELREHEQR